MDENGYNSPKLHLVYVTMFLIFGGALIAANYPAFGANYVTMVGALLGAAGIYTGGHVSTNWMMTNQQTQLAKINPPQNKDDTDTPDETLVGYLHPHKDPGVEP